MTLAFGMKKMVSALILPPAMPLLMALLGLWLLQRHPRWGKRLAWSALLLAWLSSTPAVVAVGLAPLEDVPVLAPAQLQQAEAIVVLGAGARRYLPEYDGPTPNRLALERLRYAARLARASGLPLLVSGGAPKDRVPEGQLMAAVLAEDFGVTVRWIEAASLDTTDNARFSAPLLAAAGVKQVVLVTHAAHMRRALGEFRAVGVRAFAAPTGYLHDAQAERDMFYYLPNASAAYNAWYAAHEWVGLLAQYWRLHVLG